MSQSPETPRTVEEHLAVIRGEDLGGYRQRAAIREQLSAEGEKYRNTPPNQWPPLEFNWDLSVSSQRFSLDGLTEADFQQQFPHGFRLGHVDLVAFDEKLCHFSRRDGIGELWSLGCTSELAYLIAYLAEGNPITPPLVKPLPTGEFILSGGHHRYAVAKASGQKEIPIYVLPENVDATDRIASVRWGNA